jgi:hypothetical protein
MTFFYFKKHGTNADIYDVHPTSVSTFKRLRRLDLEIYEVGHQERLAVDEDVVSH